MIILSSNLSTEQVMNNISINKKFATEGNTVIANNYQDVSFMIGTTAETIFLLLIFAACVVSNSLVFVIFYQKPTFRSLSNRFVLNLAVCNLLYSLLVIPNVIVSVVSDGSAVGLWWCRLTKVVTILLALSSAFSVILIAVDRYCAVMNPLHYNMTITSGRSILMIAFIWVLALILSVLPMIKLQIYTDKFNFGQNEERNGDEVQLLSSDVIELEPRVFSSSRCLCFTTVTTLITSYHRLWYSLTVTGLGFILPLFLLCWIYTCMYRAAKQNNDRARRHSVTTNPSEVIYHHEVLNGNCSMSSGECTPINANSNGSPLQSGHMGGFKKAFCRRRSSNASLSIIFFREEGRAAQTGFLVIVTFAFCWFPYFAFIVLEALPEWIGVPALSRILAQHLTFIGCALNPFVYVYRNRLVWKDARHVLHCSKRHNINVNINNNHVSHHSQRCMNNNNSSQRQGHFPVDSPLIAPHHNVHFQQQHLVSRALHREIACLHTCSLTNARLARSLRQAGPKIVSTATDARHHRLLYELPAEEISENIELDNLKIENNNATNLNELTVVVSGVDECESALIHDLAEIGADNVNTPSISLPIRLPNGSPTTMDYLKVENANSKPSDVIGSSWSLPNPYAFYSESSANNDSNFESENMYNSGRVNRNLCKKSVATDLIGGKKGGMDRNRIHSKSAHFARNLNSYNNENNQNTMSEIKSNFVHVCNINNNQAVNAKSTLPVAFTQRKRLTTKGCGGVVGGSNQWMAGIPIHRHNGHIRHASTTTLLDTPPSERIYIGTTI